MRYLPHILAALCLTCVCANAQTFKFGTATNPKGQSVTVDSKSLLIDGNRVLPVMGEIHYTRVPRHDWRREILKMKAGGIDIVSCYVFWNHHESVEGEYDWSGGKDLRAFLQTCKDCGQMVVLRVGPFCHGEAYLGGIPEWIVDKAIADPDNFRLRTLAPGFVDAVAKFYMEIGKQAEGLLWKDGGPVIGLQVDNESRGPWPYLATLKQKAIDAGFDLPFYTRTGWPEMNGPAVFGEILPLYGDYADGFWDRDTTDMPGDYRKAFTFSESRLSKVIAPVSQHLVEQTQAVVGDVRLPHLAQWRLEVVGHMREVVVVGGLGVLQLRHRLVAYARICAAVVHIESGEIAAGAELTDLEGESVLVKDAHASMVGGHHAAAKLAREIGVGHVFCRE